MTRLNRPPMRASGLEPTGGAVLIAVAGVLAILAPVLVLRGLEARFLLGVGIGLGSLVAILAMSARASDAARLTPATALTVLRGGAAATLVGYLLVPPASDAWLAALLFGGAVLFDGFDGWLARRNGNTSPFGARLDVEVDAFALLVGTAVAVRAGVAPTLFLAIGLARYGFLTAIWMRRQRGLAVRDLPPRFSRRALGALAMLGTFLLLTPLLGPAHGQPVAIALTAALLAGFLRDWLLVTGRR